MSKFRTFIKGHIWDIYWVIVTILYVIWRLIVFLQR